jgi:ubiquinone/menaquinone biosynthesis C-methylase UbiE
MRLPMRDGAFDLVAIGYLLHLLPPDAAVGVLREAARVLRPGGGVVAVTHSSPAGRLRRPYRGAWGLARRLGGGRVVAAEPLDDLAPLASRAGLRPTVTVRVPGPYWSQVLLADAPVRRAGVS